MILLICPANIMVMKNGRDYDGNSDSVAIALTSSLHPLIIGNSNDC